jgi:hypothetical protein
MGKTKENNTHEWHAVQCAGCSKKEVIRVALGKIGQDLRFTHQHEYLCPPCLKRPTPALKPKSLRDNLRESLS